MLADAGWKAGGDGILAKGSQKFSVSLLAPTAGGYSGWPEIVQAIQSYLKAVGIEVKIMGQEYATYLQTSRKGPKDGNFDMSIQTWGAGDPDAGMRLTVDSRSWAPAGNNIALYKNPAVDTLIDKGASAIKREDRAPFYKQAQEIVMKDAPWIFLSERRQALGHRANVKGMVYIPSSAGLLDVRKVTIG
jgi:peptide/nickel transport system substrate-binding protein